MSDGLSWALLAMQACTLLSQLFVHIKSNHFESTCGCCKVVDDFQGQEPVQKETKDTKELPKIVLTEPK